MSFLMSKYLIGITRACLSLNNLKISNNLVNLNKRNLNTDINQTPNSESVLNNIEEFETKTSNTIDESEPSIEKVVSIDEKDSINNAFSIAQARNSRSTGWNPTVETHSLLMVDGEPFNKLPIVYISATGNNTILTLTDCNGLTLYSTSAGACGFKNTRKSTAIAGQAAGLAMSDHIKRREIKNLRVMVKGFGNGRLTSIKALQMSKLQIISITDRTPIPLTFSKPPRPPVKRRI